MAALDDHCALCEGRQNLTFHHLIPRTLHSNKWFRKNFDINDMRERGITLCRKCHSFIHKQFNEKQLGREFNTLAAIKADVGVQRFVSWRRKQKQP